MADRFRTGLDWEDVRFFAALARRGSLSAAARALSVNHATVARRVAGLETALGAKLVERRPDGYALTEAGRDALATAGAMEAAAESLARMGGAAPISGLVRITATPSLAEAFLIPRFAAFCDLHPGVDVELLADRRAISLSRREADLGLRLGRPGDGELIAHRVATLDFGFYANTDWQARLAAGGEPAFVGFDETSAHLPEAIWLARRFPGHRLAFRTNSQISQASAARVGYGAALLPHFLGSADSDLRPVLTSETPPSRDLWLLRRRENPEPSPIRLAREFLIDLFRVFRAEAQRR